MPDNKEAEPFHVSMVVHAIHFFSWFYDMATYIPWQLATYSSWTYQNRLKAEPIMGDTQNPWRMVGSQQLKLRKRQDCKTLDEDFERSCQEYGSLEALGTREILSEEDEVQSNGKVFKKLIMGDYKWRTYTEFLQDVDNFGKGLVSLGLQPKQNILIFAETRAEFQIGLQACFRYNFPASDIQLLEYQNRLRLNYNGDTQNLGGCDHGRLQVEEHTQSFLQDVATFGKGLVSLGSSIQKDIPTVTHIICMEDPVAKLDEKKLSNGIKVTSFQAVINRGAASKNVERVRPTAEDLAIIMYTRGINRSPKTSTDDLTYESLLARCVVERGGIDASINDVEWRKVVRGGHMFSGLSGRTVTRPIVPFDQLIMGDYKWRTYTEFLQDVDNFGKGLVSLGLQPKQNILIFAETRAEFQIGLQACFRYNFPAVTLYATLGEAAIAYGINQTGIKYVITTTTLLTKLKSIQKDIPTVTHIICMEDPVAKLDEKKLSNGIKVTSFQAVINRGAASKSEFNDALRGVAKIAKEWEERFKVGETAAVYLPLAHILECVVELSLITLGCRLGYSSPQTLTDTGTKIKKGCPGDVRILKPNLIIFVPMILERIYKGITEKVKGGSALQRAIFNFAVDYKCKHLDQGFNTPILNRLIFSKLTRQLGGQVRLMICGGAPLASDLQRFIQSCFNSSLIQGYGLTETCGVACVSESRDMRIGHVGPPVTTTQVKLVDWPEGGYTNKDKPNPRGEVIVGGQNIAMGYYQMDQLTKEVFIQDNGIRYFCTGDIGEFLPDGSLKIIDRKKDLVKLQTGEYISLATIENFLKKSPFIDNICVYADPLYDYCLALIVPYKKAVQEAANNNNLAGKSFEELCGRSEILKEVLASLAATGKEAKLQKWEIPRKVHLCEEAWTPENGLVTDAFKLKRKPIANQYSAEINRMYGKHR
eukprot:XP_011665127.1 PREDICTED: long-chain-fatty-acid--CoA ligase 4 [Strongylocentrotus purpuratus]